MLPVGITRYVDFSLADDSSNPVAGRTLAVWRSAPNKLIFLRNTLACADPLSLKDYGDGRYTISYSPSAPGHDYLQVWDNALGLSILDIEDIVPADFALGSGAMFVVNQDFGGPGVLKVVVPQPDSYALQVFLSSDWEANRRSDAYAAGSSYIKPDGSWVSSVSLPAGTYHVVISKSGAQQIIRPYLGVG